MPYLVVIGIGLWCLAALLWVPAMIFISSQWIGAYLLTVAAMVILGVAFCGIVVAHILERQSGRVRLWDEARAAKSDIDLD